jgi:hypothetical protein
MKAGSAARRGAGRSLAAFTFAALASLSAWSAVAPPSGPTVYVGGAVLDPEVPSEGDSITISVQVVNNGTVDLVLARVVVSIIDPAGAPSTLGRRDGVPLPARSNVSLDFRWMAVSGDQTLAVEAAIAQGNGSIPLQPFTMRFTVVKAPIQEPGLVTAYVVGVLAAVVLLAITPAVVESVRPGGAPAARPAAGPKRTGSPPRGRKQN